MERVLEKRVSESYYKPNHYSNIESNKFAIKASKYANYLIDKLNQLNIGEIRCSVSASDMNLADSVSFNFYRVLNSNLIFRRGNLKLVDVYHKKEPLFDIKIHDLVKGKGKFLYHRSGFKDLVKAIIKEHDIKYNKNKINLFSR